MSVTTRDHVSMVQTAQNAVEVSQVRRIGRIADGSAMMERQVPTIQIVQTPRQVLAIQTAQRTAGAPQEQYSARDR